MASLLETLDKGRPPPIEEAIKRPLAESLNVLVKKWPAPVHGEQYGGDDQPEPDRRRHPNVGDCWGTNSCYNFLPPAPNIQVSVNACQI